MTIPQLDPGPCAAWNEAAFAGGLRMDFGQAWRTDIDPGFRPADVRLGWSAGALEVLATLHDDHVVTAATADQQRLWELGDVFEIFLRVDGEAAYSELHVAPTGHRLQLRFASREAFAALSAGRGRLNDCFVSESLFDSAVRTIDGGWQVRARVPMTVAGGGKIFASFGRYDYTPGTKPVISSTTPHRVGNFHHLDEWPGLTVPAAGAA